MQKSKCILIYGIIIISIGSSNAQLSGFLKTGLNFGFINKEYWHTNSIPDTIYYGKPLIRPVLGLGMQYRVSDNFVIRQEVFYQNKGQGAKTPDVWSFFQTSNKDVLRFVSFPFSIHYSFIPHIYLGFAYQPSLYISGNDNFIAKEPWYGWIHGVTSNIHVIIRQKYELGLEYDYDLSYYYCIDCDHRFITWRIFGMYHFED